ncbi:MAG: hypothetical protein M4579_002884 [Chaenotheca gracillima]|nr:MAG: hypothetical protein M4579_002884 [Chaenotheca gracillima]
MLEIGANQPLKKWTDERAESSAGRPAPEQLVSRGGQSQLEDKPAKESETMLFRGKAFKTQFYGATNPTSLLTNFPEVRGFMNDVIEGHSGLGRLRSDLQALKTRRKAAKGSEIAPSMDADLRKLIPSREVADHFVHLYMSTLETTYRILHVPTFWKQYESCWDDPQRGGSDFVVVMLLAMATVRCASPKEPTSFIGDSSSSREIALQCIELCESWLQRQSAKHIRLPIFQIHCLLLLAKQANSVKIKQHWINAGNVLRTAISAGIHRDPTLLGGKVSVFNQEMRRRIWATIVELELQTSLNRGVQSSVSNFPADCGPPSNINDEDISEASQRIPASKPWHQYTDTSFLHISHRSLSLRTTLNSLLNHPGSRLQYEEVLLFDEKIMHFLDEIPAWGTRVAEREEDRDPSVVARTLLDIQLRQYLIFLHNPFVRKAGSNSRYSYSRMVSFNAARSILEQHSKLAAAGNHALGLLRNDVYRAALCICFNVFVSSLVRNEFYPQHNLSTSLSQPIEKTLALLEDKIMRLGQGFRQYWFVSTAYGLVYSTLSPEHSALQKQQAIDRVQRLYYKVLGSQEDLTRAIVLSDEGMRQAEPVNNAGPTPEGFDYVDLSGWTLDNLWTFDVGDM